MRQGFASLRLRSAEGADTVRNGRQKMGVLVDVLPTEKPMSQAVAQVSKTIQSSRWTIASTRALPSIISVNTMLQRPSPVQSHTIFVVNVPAAVSYRGNT
jgi:hypothetical protein